MAKLTQNLTSNSYENFIRKLILGPLAMAYGFSQLVYRQYWSSRKPKPRGSLLPLFVVGGLRAGGSGKTSVVLKMARLLKSHGLRVGVLAYWIRKPFWDKASLVFVGTGLTELTSKSSWKLCSDEAVLLFRSSGARVFVTRNRSEAWSILSRKNEFDVLISDDGLMDPRLNQAFRIVLRETFENPGLMDLLPAGPYRLTMAILGKVNCIASGPNPSEKDLETGMWFRRTLEFPPSFDRKLAWWIVCGLGNPKRLTEDLLQLGIQIAGCLTGPNHGIPSKSRWLKARKQAPGCGFLCTEKDWVKLQEFAAIFGNLALIQEQIELSREFEQAILNFLSIETTS